MPHFCCNGLLGHMLLHIIPQTACSTAAHMCARVVHAGKHQQQLAESN
jgi:hypothetical protein